MRAGREAFGDKRFLIRKVQPGWLPGALFVSLFLSDGMHEGMQEVKAHWTVGCY
jgi:hypothetical protein